MLIDPLNLQNNLDRLEEIEKASLRLVTQGVYEYRDTAVEVFRIETDKPADIGEDVTREALDRLGTSKIDQRIFGKVDYKRARFLFHPDYAIKQALFVDSKAEQVQGSRTATLQISQISMAVRQIRAGQTLNEQGKLPVVVHLKGEPYITTTVFVKYNYKEIEVGGEIEKNLESITVAALPNGLLQDRYNPDANDTVWLVGRNAPSLEEEFRVRLSFPRLKQKANWRVQYIPMSPSPFLWDD